MRNFKIIFGLVIIILLLVLAGMIIFKIIDKNDTWQCENGEWIKKGNPEMPMPLEMCEKKVEKVELPKVELPKEGDDQEAWDDFLSNFDAFRGEGSNVMIKIPDFWKDGYEKVVEEDDGVTRIIFNYSIKKDERALLFIINIIPGTRDVYSVENQTNNKIIAQDQNYYYTVSKALDMPFAPEDPNYRRYLNMAESIDNVLNDSIFGDIHNARSEMIVENDDIGKWKINVSYPRIATMLDRTVIDQNILNKTQELIINFKNNISEWDATGATEEAFSSLWLNYRLLSIADDIIVLEVYGSEYFRGAAHPNDFSYSINYDLKNSKEINLSNLFKVNEEVYLAKLSELVKAKLEAEFKEKGIETDTLMFDEGIKALASNFDNFNLLEDKIIFNFDTYQLGPRAIGSFKAEISRESLNDILK